MAGSGHALSGRRTSTPCSRATTRSRRSCRSAAIRCAACGADGSGPAWLSRSGSSASATRSRAISPTGRRGSRNSGHEVHIASGRYNPREGELDGLVVHQFQRARPAAARASRPPLPDRPRPAGHRAAGRPDVVHAHYLLPYGYWAARAGTHPLVVSPWGTDALVDGRPGARGHDGAHEAIAAADLVIVNSRALERAAAELDAPADRVRYVLWHADLSASARSGGTPLPRAPRLARGRLRRPLAAQLPARHSPRHRSSARSTASGATSLARGSARCRGGPLRGEIEQLVERLGLRDVIAFASVPALELPARDRLGGLRGLARRLGLLPASLLETMASGAPARREPAPSIEEWIGRPRRRRSSRTTTTSPSRRRCSSSRAIPGCGRATASGTAGSCTRGSAIRPPSSSASTGGAADEDPRPREWTGRIMRSSSSSWARASLPTISRLAREGTFGPLRSTIPAFTPAPGRRSSPASIPAATGSSTSRRTRIAARRSSRAPRAAPARRSGGLLGAAGVRSAFVGIPITLSGRADRRGSS